MTLPDTLADVNLSAGSVEVVLGIELIIAVLIWIVRALR